MRTVCLSLCLLVTVGCAAREDLLLTGVGRAPVKATEGRRAVPLARRAALLAAQRDLVERYAGMLFESDAEVAAFVRPRLAALADGGGLLRGARVARVCLSPDRRTCEVAVEARRSDLRRALGTASGPPRVLQSRQFAWPGESGGGPIATSEPLRLKAGLLSAVGTVPLPKDARSKSAQQQAAREAADAARRKLAQRVRKLRLNRNTTVEDFLENREEQRGRVLALIRSAPITRRTARPDGSLEVEVTLDLRKVRAVLGLE